LWLRRQARNRLPRRPAKENENEKNIQNGRRRGVWFRPRGDFGSGPNTNDAAESQTDSVSTTGFLPHSPIGGGAVFTGCAFLVQAHAVGPCNRASNRLAEAQNRGGTFQTRAGAFHGLTFKPSLAAGLNWRSLVLQSGFTSSLFRINCAHWALRSILWHREPAARVRRQPQSCLPAPSPLVAVRSTIRHGGNTATGWAALSAHRKYQWQEIKYQLPRSHTAW